jgi:hypothetical protein
MIVAEKKIIRGVARKMNEINIPNQRPIVEYIANEFKQSLPIYIDNKKEPAVESGIEPTSAASSPVDSYLNNLKQRLTKYY